MMVGLVLQSRLLAASSDGHHQANLAIAPIG